MKHHKTNLERLQTLSLKYQYYLSNQDQHPVHTVHRPVLLQPVHKEHGPETALRLNPLTTITGKENLAQQYKSARSQDSGRTVLYPDHHVLTNDEHWTMTPEAHKNAAQQGHFVL